MKTRKVGIIGLGHVGAHVAYALAIQGIADELVLVDHNPQKLASEVQDLRDAVAYMPHRVTVNGGDFADLGGCDVIVNSVGKIELLETHDRLSEMDFTIWPSGAMPTRLGKAALPAFSSTSPTPAISSPGSLPCIWVFPRAVSSAPAPAWIPPASSAPSTVRPAWTTSPSPPT